MFNIKDEVVIKDLDEMLKSGVLKKYTEINDITVYINQNTNFILFSDFPYFGKSDIIQQIDNKDKQIPYFLEKSGIWAADFMLKSKNEHIEGVEENNDQKPKEKVYINKYTNKPFGNLFIKLIQLDEKISEFSNTSFSKLHKNELEYIAKLLMNHNKPFIDVAKTKAKDLATYCYQQAKTL